MSRLVGTIAIGYVILGSAAIASGAPSATRAAVRHWQVSIAHVVAPGLGCYHASYPALRWFATSCKVASNVPFVPPRIVYATPGWPLGSPPAAGFAPVRHPDAVGNGLDYAAAAAGTISQVTGTFNNVSSAISETGQYGGGGSQLANTFSLQLNSQFFSSPACSGSPDPADCVAWQQFIYDSHNNVVYMQYWLIAYDAVCPTGWYQYGSDCYTNSLASTVSGGPLAAESLATLSFAGRAQSGGNDEVSLSVGGGTATMVSNSDSMVDLADAWNAAEFDVFGDGGGGEANFGSDTTLDPQTAIVDGTSEAPPSCVKEGFTAETNNLSLSGAPALGTEPSPTIESAQTNGTATTPSCAAAAGGYLITTDAHLTAAPSSPVTNQVVTLTATVTPASAAPSGTVAFDNHGVPVSGCGDQVVALSDASYTARCRRSFTAASSPEALSAIFTPTSSSVLTSTSSLDSLTIARDATATSLGVSTATPVVGKNLTYTATVAPSESGAAIPSGWVEFLAGGTPITACDKRPLSGGKAGCTLSYAATGRHSITASYFGDLNFLSSISRRKTVSVEPSGAQVRAALEAVLRPPGKAVRISSILKSGGYTYSFAAPSAGTLVVDWYATVAGKKALVAAGSRLSRSAGKRPGKLKLTSKGRKLLKSARRVHLVSTASFTPPGTTSTSASRRFTLRH